MSAADLLLGFVAAFALAMVTVPVGVSGAVFLLPVQVSVLGVPSPSVTPTNLLYNIVATPGALLQYRRVGRLGGPLVRQMLIGTVPGVVVGAVIRVTLVPSGAVFRLLLGLFLLPLGVWLLSGWRPHADRPRELRYWQLVSLAGVVGVIGGVYGIGGGSILAPVLVGLGLTVVEVAPAALTATFVTSCAGVIAYALLGVAGQPAAAPQWALGVALGLGGLLGGTLGARLQPRLPETLLRRLLGALACGVALAYLIQALT
jgi:hypothetical protein